MDLIEQKANELVEKFSSYTKIFIESRGWYEGMEAAKQCALICVDELINWNELKNLIQEKEFLEKVKERLLAKQ